MHLQLYNLYFSSWSRAIIAQTVHLFSSPYKWGIRSENLNGYKQTEEKKIKLNTQDLCICCCNY